MLSRRNIRIKVMQVLYAMNRDKTVSLKDSKNCYNDKIKASYHLYLQNIKLFIDIATFCYEDNKRRSSKHLPTEEDKSFTPRLCDNILMDSLCKNESLEKIFKSKKIESSADDDMRRLIYTEFSKTEPYINYIAAKEVTVDMHRDILLQLYRFCTSHEVFEEVLEDQYSNWIDDKSLVVGTMKKTIKAMPLENFFYDEYVPTKDTVENFGQELLSKTHTNNDALLTIIEPTLKNWDADRVAVIDMILIKMALCELMEFPSIPTKVTLNEFLEIAKNYSTAKSKDFINGILDRLMKVLSQNGKIKKEGRGLVE